MLPVTYDTVLAFLKEAAAPVSFTTMEYHFILDEERQLARLQKTLEKLYMQKKIEVLKPRIDDPVFAMNMVFGDRNKPMFRYYKFIAIETE